MKYKKKKKNITEDISVLRQKFNAKNEILRDFHLKDVSVEDFLRFIFPYGRQEKSTDRGETGVDRHPNAILTSIKDPAHRGRTFNRILFDDFKILDELRGHKFVITSPVAFYGKSRKADNAYLIYGLAIDLDYVEENNARDLIFQMVNGVLPAANFIVNSGTGFHIYYLFETPVPAYNQYVIKLGKFKEALTKIVWNRYTSQSRTKQYQGIFQGYRLPGTQTKLGEDYLVTAFKFNDNRLSFNYLNEFVNAKARFNYDDGHLTIEEAKEKYEEWYTRRIVDARPVGDYKLSETERKRRRAWYDKWMIRIKEHARDGNRYYCIGILFNYAMKAEIPIDDTRKDAKKLLPYLNSLTEDITNEFTQDDIDAAEKFYDRKYIKIGLEFIEKKTGVKIERTERNSPEKRIRRKPLPNDSERQCNLKARAWGPRDAIYPNGAWRNVTGRPVGSKNKEKSDAYLRVVNFIDQNPNESSVSVIARTVGAARGTVYRVLNDIKESKKKELIENDMILGCNDSHINVSDEIKKAAAKMMNDFKK